MVLPRKIFLLTCFLFCLNSVLAQKIVKAKKVQVSNGLVCYKKSENPFTGIVTGDYLAIYGAFLNTESSKPGMVEFSQCISLFYKYSDMQMFKDSEFSFKEGKFDGLSKIWAGNSISKLNFNSGKLDGLITILDKEGNQKYQCTYENGEKNGLCKEWFSNGNQNFEGSYKDKKKDGLHIYWGENGDWTSIKYYVDGELNYIEKGDLSQEIVDVLPTKVKELKLQNGKVCYTGTSVLFSGIFQKFRYDGKLNYECSYNNGEKDGLYKEWYSNGNQKKVEGSYEDGEKNGLIREWYSSGNQKFEGSYKDGEKNGLIREWYSSGNQKFEGSYKDGEKDGLFMEWDTEDVMNLHKYENGFKTPVLKDDLNQELLNILNIPTDVNFSDIKKIGELYYYEAIESLAFTGFIKEYYPNGKLKLEFVFLDGDFIFQKWYYANGYLAELADYKMREFKVYHKNGKLRYDSENKVTEDHNAGIDKDVYSTYINSNRIKGWHKGYHENEKIHKQFKIIESYSGYLEFNKDSLSKEWYSNGVLSKECNFINGILEGSYKEWHKNGNLKLLASYTNAEKEGLFKEWYENGRLSTQTSYINGEKEGLYKEWHENGRLRVQTSYTNGTLDGSYKRWYSDGRLYADTKYRSGVEY